jgi:hypothetical protein
MEIHPLATNLTVGVMKIYCNDGVQLFFAVIIRIGSYGYSAVVWPSTRSRT